MPTRAKWIVLVLCIPALAGCNKTLCGAFLAVVGVAVSCTAGVVGNSTVVILGIVLLLVGAGLGARYK